MSSESRSSSAVRNLRSIFENKASEQQTTPDSRGRSPNGFGSSDKENNYQQQARGKVRASFVAVEPAPHMAASVENASGRRGSFGEADGDLELRKVISDQQEQLGVPEGAIESMPPSVAATPLKPPSFGQLGHDSIGTALGAEKAPENPDKPVTGAEEEPGDMKPADPSNEDAVSGGEALPPVAEDLTSTKKPTPASSKTAKKAEAKATPPNGKPAAISTKTATKPPASSIKSPTSQPKTPVSAKAASAAPPQSPLIAKKTSRSSLTAPTAASLARAGAASEKTKTSPEAKPKPREVTKPINLPSHLTAPTAASKAKHDPEAVASATSLRTSLASRPKPAAPAAKPVARASLAGGQRPHSRESLTSGRRSLAAVDGSFLDRMTRPTAASSGHRHEKIAPKSPPKTKATPAPKPKVNGHISKSAAEHTTASADAGKPEEAANVNGEQSGISLAANATTLEEAMAAVDDQGTGNETPNHTSIEQGDAALEATPAGLGAEIR